MAQYKSQMRTLTTSLALAASLGLTCRVSSSLVTRLLFPSGDVTLAKWLWLVLGMGLASVHLNDVVDRWRYKKITVTQQWYLVDNRGTNAISGRYVEVDTQFFQGQLRVMTNRKSFGLQIQGRFKKNVPMINNQLVVAVRLPVQKIQMTWVAGMLVNIVNTLCSYRKVHSSLGNDNWELPYAEIPLQLCENSQFGADIDNSELKSVSCFAAGRVYTFEARVNGYRWWLATVMFTLAAWIPIEWMNLPLVQISSYLVPKPLKKAPKAQKLPHHTKSDRKYVFCFSVYRQNQAENSEIQGLRIALPDDKSFPDFEVGSPISLLTDNGQRGGVPVAHAAACRQIAENARALGRLDFSLDVWVEFVDRIAGRRKVGYLLTVVDLTKGHRRIVMRSATTVKNALLLLRLEHQLDRKETESETGIGDIEDQEQAQLDESVDFQHLSVESREYRYEQIENETTAVAHVLEQVARKPSQGRRRWRQPQRCYQNQLEKATLYRCLMSTSRLPSVPSYESIGVQINASQHLAMNVVSEAGVYRLHNAGDGTTPLLRQEWFIISADYLHFFRSYSVTPCLSIPVTHVLNVSSIERVHMLQGSQLTGVHQEGGVPRWNCVEIHLVLEIVTVFVETPEERDRLVASLQPLTIDNCDEKVTIPAKATSSEAIAASPLFLPMTLDSQSQPVCLNQRTSRFMDKEIDTPSILKQVHESLEAGLEVFALGETGARLRINRAIILRLLDNVEKLNGLDLDNVASDTSNEDRLALGLNFYHTLFIHAVLVFGYPSSHEQWKLLQTVPCYLVKTQGGTESVRFTLADIQRVMLRCPVPVTLEASSLQRSLTQNAIMDLAIGSGDAIDGLCRTVLGVAWTPVLPCSSSYSAIRKTPLPIPSGLAIDCSDVRTSMILQINSSPPIAKTTGIICVYDGGDKLNEQLNSTCTLFLARELQLNEVTRVIYLPKVCEWYRIGYSDEDDEDDAVNRRMGPLTQHRRRRNSSNASTGGLAALPKSRSFYCLQRLLGFMKVEQHHRVMHLLLGAGEECKFVFTDFWTRPSRSVAANFLTSAGNAALAVFKGSNASDSFATATGNDGDWFSFGQQSRS